MAAPTPTPGSAGGARSNSTTRAPQSSRFEAVRTPFLAWLGAGDLALRKLGELPAEARDRLNSDELRKHVDEAGARARQVYAELADRGEDTLQRIQRRPGVARMLRGGEEARARLSTRTRSVGERTARATQQSTRAAAETVMQAGDNAADSIEQAGDDAARATRSGTRKAANQTAPAKPAAGSRGGATGSTSTSGKSGGTSSTGSASGSPATKASGGPAAGAKADRDK